MKTFKDLNFVTHPNNLEGLQARMDFKNNYGVSVVKFNGSYGSQDDLWEVGIMYEKRLTYSTHITNDVLGWQTEENVTEIMKQVQNL